MRVLEAAEPPLVCRSAAPAAPAFDLLPAREARIGPNQAVRRALPRRARRMVGAWCFLDHFGGDATLPEMDIPPHPHMGLQTVTWLFGGEVLHRDSLGSEQRIRPSELNLMTSGGGIAHSEESRGEAARGLHGLQLWTALPDASRHGPPAFRHHTDLPVFAESGARVTLAMGTLAGRESPARTDSRIVAAEIRSGGGAFSLPLEAAFEHAIFVVSGAVAIDGSPVAPNVLAYLGMGRARVDVAGPGETIAFLIGGAPFSEEVVMWWNFVARSRAEIAQARREWESGGRFGVVAGYPGERLAAPALPEAAG